MLPALHSMQFFGHKKIAVETEEEISSIISSILHSQLEHLLDRYSS